MHPRFAFHPFAGPAIAAGGLLFSGSIFALTLNNKLKVLGPVTPLGGVFLIAGSVIGLNIYVMLVLMRGIYRYLSLAI